MQHHTACALVCWECSRSTCIAVCKLQLQSMFNFIQKRKTNKS